MTSPSPDADLRVLTAAAAEACALLRSRYGDPVQTWSKGEAGPVTEVDLAVDRLLRERLSAARPDYGWLSEETADDPARLGKARVFIVDPLDGTLAYLKRAPEFATALAVVEAGTPIAAVVANPITGEVFAAARGRGATLNGAPLRVSDRAELEDAHLIGKPEWYRDPRWAQPWPNLRLTHINALTYRLALVGAGAFDGVVALGFKNDWDIAPGALIVTEAGGCVSDPWGAPLRFNQPEHRVPGAVAAGPRLHPLLIERLEFTPHPAQWAGAQG